MGFFLSGVVCLFCKVEAAELQCHPAAVSILRGYFFIQRVRSVSVHQSIVLHDKGPRRILAPGSIVFFHQIVAQFCALFAPVNAADSTEVEAQVKALQEGWAARGIAFADSRASMISVVFHDKFSDEDNTLFIGHVGVLLPAEDGSLYFIEKVAFQEPYRLVKLQNRTELSDYLMEKYDTSWGQDTTHPFIMENDTLMDGYRPNPLEETNP